jgi:hypothetical protein
MRLIIPTVIAIAYAASTGYAFASSAPRAVVHAPAVAAAGVDTAVADTTVVDKKMAAEIGAASHRLDADTLSKVQAAVAANAAAQLAAQLHAQSEGLATAPTRADADAASALRALQLRAAGAVSCASTRAPAVCVSVAPLVI